MLKTFRQMREALETGGLSPRPRQEKAFAALHTVEKTDRLKAPQSNTAPTSAEDAKASISGEHSQGEREVENQGTSKLKDLSGFRGQQSPPRPADRRDDLEKKPLRISPSAVKPISEASDNPGAQGPRVKRFLQSLAKAGRSAQFEFENGKALNVTPQQAAMLLSVMDDISPERADKMAARMQAGPTEFLRVLDFASTLH